MASFAGGFAEGFNATFNTVSRAMDRRRALEQQAQQASQARASDRVNQGIEIINNIALAFAHAQSQQDRDPGTIAAQGSSLSQMMAQAQAQLGSDLFRAGLANTAQEGQRRAQLIIQSAMQQHRNALFAQAEQQRVETEGRVAEQQALIPGKVAEQQALLPGRVAEAGATAEAQARGTMAAGGGPLVNFSDREGNILGAARLNSPEAQAFIDQGAVSFSAQLQGSGQEVFGVPGTERQRGVSARAQGRTAGNIAEGVNLLQRAEELGPGVAGVRGAAGSGLASVVGQIDNDLGDIVSEAITDVDQETLQRFRTDAQAVIAAAVEPFTGENSGRVTQRELEIADNALRVARAFSSFAQLRGALRSAIALQYTVLDREAREAGGEPVPLDTPEQQDEFGARLLEIGLPPELVAEIIVKIIRERRVRESVVQ